MLFKLIDESVPLLEIPDHGHWVWQNGHRYRPDMDEKSIDRSVTAADPHIMKLLLNEDAFTLGEFKKISLIGLPRAGFVHIFSDGWAIEEVNVEAVDYAIFNVKGFTIAIEQRVVATPQHPRSEVMFVALKEHAANLSYVAVAGGGIGDRFWWPGRYDESKVPLLFNECTAFHTVSEWAEQMLRITRARLVS